MTNPFIIPSLANLNADLAQRHFPLAKGEELQQTFAQLFSRHLGRLQSGKGFEACSLLVTGLSGSGKTAEISDMLNRFKESAVRMPDGKDARFASCVLEAKGSWKDLGRKTLHALGYVQREPQLDRLMIRIEFQEIDLSSAPGHPAQDYETLNEIVGSYAISAGLDVDASLPTGDFLHRLATACAFRWGLVIDMVVDAVALAVARREGVVERSDFVAAWCEKTGMNQLATPFIHDSYETMFRRDKPFRAAIGT
ncbi:ATP-binding protein [Pseudooceanicola spongiae]|uniref:ATP-binding protein n=1 Tax=Pseudooceanicola spongiae TaxID=2613965 RepID=A0A7L9WU22_9RHOB|nr:ATP-binding protein [Pseudooceanicola spongiae]QOL83008.1 ATP-binding protein [Pseudooceanicola spongiae]